MQSCTAVVGVGQLAVVLEAGHLAPRQDGGQPRVLRHGEAPAQRIAHQAVDGHGAQVLVLQPQQRHRTAAELRAQQVHQPLQAHGLRQLAPQVGPQGGQHRLGGRGTGFENGHFNPLMVF
jgi:hypothetical protein